MIDPDGMSSDTTRVINLVPVVIRPQKVMEPVTGMWSYLLHSISPRQYTLGCFTYDVDNAGYAQPIVRKMEMPDLSVKNGYNTVYKGKKGVCLILGRHLVFSKDIVKPREPY